MINRCALIIFTTFIVCIFNISPSNANEIGLQQIISTLNGKDAKKISRTLNYLKNKAKRGDVNSIDLVAGLYEYGYPIYARPQILKEDKLLQYAYSVISKNLGSKIGASVLDQTETWNRYLSNSDIKAALSIATSWQAGEELPTSSGYNAPPFVQVMGEDTLKITGIISSDSYNEFASKFNDNIKNIIVNSPGGLVEEGAKIGLMLIKKGITVIVDGECLSSCANYIFTAAETRIIRPRSIVCFHGGGRKTNHLNDDSLTENVKDVAAMEFRILDTQDISRDVVSDNIVINIDNKIASFERSNAAYTIMSCPTSTDMIRFNIKVKEMWYPGSGDNDGIFDLGRKYHHNLLLTSNIWKNKDDKQLYSDGLVINSSK